MRISELINILQQLDVLGSKNKIESMNITISNGLVLNFSKDENNSTKILDYPEPPEPPPKDISKMVVRVEPKLHSEWRGFES